jgi:hypothetical protein
MYWYSIVLMGKDFYVKVYVGIMYGIIDIITNCIMWNCVGWNEWLMNNIWFKPLGKEKFVLVCFLYFGQNCRI